MTLGNGGYEPTGIFFQLATVAASATGFFVVTLSITYLVPVVSAVVQRRQLATQISGLGGSAEQIVVQAWTGDGFPTFPLQLVALSSTIATVAEQHTAYPVLRLFHSQRSQLAPTPQVAALADALLLLRDGVDQTCRPPEGLLRSVSDTISTYWQVLPVELGLPDQPPPAPSLESLRNAGIPVVDATQFTQAVEARTEERRRMLALQHSAGWFTP